MAVLQVSNVSTDSEVRQWTDIRGGQFVSFAGGNLQLSAYNPQQFTDILKCIHHGITGKLTFLLLKKIQCATRAQNNRVACNSSLHVGVWASWADNGCC
jgi:hypothetical protein